MSILAIFILGLLGGAIAEGLQYAYTRRNFWQSFQITRAVIISLVAGAWAAIYFIYVDPVTVGAIVVVHYGVFVALLAEDIVPSSRRTATPAIAQVTAPGSSVLVLNGFWAVCGMGAFGALLAELYVLYSERARRRRRSTFYWIVTGLMVVASGIVTALYGITNVSGVLAMQIGASGPLIMKRLRPE